MSSRTRESRQAQEAPSDAVATGREGTNGLDAVIAVYNKRDAIAVLVLVGLAVLSWLPRLQGPIDLRWDGGAYYVLGTSLAQGKGYRLLNEPGEIQTTLHPPMLPAIIALHQLVLRTDHWTTVATWLRRSYFLVFVAYAVAVYFLLRVFLPAAYGLLAAMVCLFQFFTVFMSDLCYPEILFALVTVLFTFCQMKKGSRARFWLGPLAAIAFALRVIGVALLMAWVVESVCQRRFRRAGIQLAGALTLIGCWLGYVLCVESGREYQKPAYEYQRADYNYVNVSYARNLRYKDPFSPELGYASLPDRVRRFLGNVTAMPMSLGETVSTPRTFWDWLRTAINRRVGATVLPPLMVPLALFLLAAFTIWGLGLLWVRRQYFIPLYAGFTVASVCATPWPGQVNRYLAPLAAFLSLSLFLAVRVLARELAPRRSRWSRVVQTGLTSAVALVIFTAQAAGLIWLYHKGHLAVTHDVGRAETVKYRLFFYRNLDYATDVGLDWLRRYSRSGEVVAATDPQGAYLRTGLKAILPPFETDAARAQYLLDSAPARYLIVDEGDYRKYTARVIAAYPERWRRIYVNGSVEENGAPSRFEIYERVSAQ